MMENDNQKLRSVLKPSDCYKLPKDGGNVAISSVAPLLVLLKNSSAYEACFSPNRDYKIVLKNFS